MIADVIIALTVLVLLGAVVAVCCSVFRSLRVNKRKAVENGVPVGRIGWCTLAATLAVAAVAWAFSSFTDMCIITALVLLVVASGVVAVEKVCASRRHKNQG